MVASELPDSAQHSAESVISYEEMTPHLPTDSPPSELTAPVKEVSGGAGRVGPPSRLSRGFARMLRKNQDYIRISLEETRQERLPTEWWKTAVSFVWAGSMLFCTTVMITIVNERVPAKENNPPLPDKFFEIVPRQDWAFKVTEVLGILLTLTWALQWLCLKHKSIVARRFFFMIGILYLYRIITMYITTLPVPSTHMNCAPKLYDDSMGKVYRVLQLLSGGGLSITGSHMMCGDFLYSGHTVMLTLTFLFIREYSPRSMWWYHLICWVLSVVGVVFILVAHEHYSVDVVVAYYVTSRLFNWYHTMANHQSLKDSPQNYLNRVWWRFFFNLMERNVCCPVPCTFHMPFSLPSSCSVPNLCESYSIVHTGREE